MPINKLIKRKIYKQKSNKRAIIFHKNANKINKPT